MHQIQNLPHGTKALSVEGLEVEACYNWESSMLEPAILRAQTICQQAESPLNLLEIRQWVMGCILSQVPEQQVGADLQTIEIYAC